MSARYSNKYSHGNSGGRGYNILEESSHETSELAHFNVKTFLTVLTPQQQIVGSGATCEARALPGAGIPAKAGIYSASHWRCVADGRDPHLRGNNQRLEADYIPDDTTTQKRTACLTGGFGVMLEVCCGERQTILPGDVPPLWAQPFSPPRSRSRWPPRSLSVALSLRRLLPKSLLLQLKRRKTSCVSATSLPRRKTG